MKKNDAVFIKLLAEADVLFEPIRRWGFGTLSASQYIARQKFKTSGVPWASKARSEQGRKRMQRALEDAAAQGLLEVFRSDRELSGVRLTDRAEARARALCGVGGEHEAYLSMCELRKHSNIAGREMLDLTLLDVWIPETTLAGYEWGDHSEEALGNFAAVWSMMAWALLRMLVQPTSDAYGRAYYRITNEGWKKLKSGWHPPEDEDLYDDDANQFYYATKTAARNRFASKERSQEIGLLPFTCSPGGLKLFRKDPSRENVLQMAYPIQEVW